MYNFDAVLYEFFASLSLVICRGRCPRAKPSFTCGCAPKIDKKKISRIQHLKIFIFYGSQRVPCACCLLSTLAQSYYCNDASDQENISIALIRWSNTFLLFVEVKCFEQISRFSPLSNEVEYLPGSFRRFANLSSKFWNMLNGRDFVVSRRYLHFFFHSKTSQRSIFPSRERTPQFVMCKAWITYKSCLFWGLQRWKEKKRACIVPILKRMPHIMVRI